MAWFSYVSPKAHSVEKCVQNPVIATAWPIYLIGIPLHG
jgi:hypothetical protein